MCLVKFVAKSQWHLEAELIDANPKLPVVDNKKCVGLLRLHDLYQTKLL